MAKPEGNRMGMKLPALRLAWDAQNSKLEVIGEIEEGNIKKSLLPSGRY